VSVRDSRMAPVEGPLIIGDEGADRLCWLPTSAVFTPFHHGAKGAAQGRARRPGYLLALSVPFDLVNNAAETPFVPRLRGDWPQQ
jgi:hypothetical protein